MSLYVEQLSALLFKSDNGRELVNQLNSTLKALIYNDSQLIDASQISPRIWECKWLNNQSIKGYSKGYAVWMNTNTYENVVNTRYSHILEVVQNNPVLGPMLAQCENQDQERALIIAAAKGTASRNVQQIYCLGDINDHVQIRVSTKDNNKALPTDDSAWEDFYIRSTFEDNTSTMLSILDDELSSQWLQHLNDYHANGILSNDLLQRGFFIKDPFDVSNVKQQVFFDHTYCHEMSGFDYAVSWKVNADRSSWCRTWRSGYIEQGGFVDNIAGKDFIDVQFMTPYSYPTGSQFYQQGYSKYGDSSREIECKLSNSKRYVVHVTPILKNDAQTAYPENAKNVQNEIVYSCTDVTNISNTGFSIVNVDKNADLYKKYSWSASGYVVAV